MQKKVVINTVPKYYYYQRSNSIIQSKFTKDRMDGLYFAKEQLTFISERHPKLAVAARNRLFVEAIYISSRVPTTLCVYRKDRKAVLRVISQFRKSVLFDRKAKMAMRQRALIAFLGARTMVAIYRTRSFIKRCIRRATRQSYAH